jgi:hypothetical protein
MKKQKGRGPQKAPTLHVVQLRIAEQDFTTLSIISDTLGTSVSGLIRSIVEDMREPFEAMADACSSFEKGATVAAADLLRRTMADAVDLGRETKAKL